MSILPSTIIIGGGPGGLGPLIWAAQTANLHSWLTQGVTIIDRQQTLGGTLGRYAINSDSFGAAYLECLEAPQAIDMLRQLCTDPVVLEMQRYRHGLPPLALVDRFMRRIGLALEQMIRDYQNCSTHLGGNATALHLQRDGSLLVRMNDSYGRRSQLVARTAIMALGGHQHWRYQLWQDLRPGLALTDCRLRHMIPSDRLLTAEGLREVEQVLDEAGNRRIVILGGSHSAYSAAWALTNLIDPSKVVPRQIMILSRRPPPIFYADRSAAEADGYSVASDDICPRTNRVHRLGGLRGNGRDLWRWLARRPYTTPEDYITTAYLNEMRVTDLRKTLEEAAVVIPAFGYSAATLPIYDPQGRRLTLQAERGLASVNDTGKVLLADGRPLPNVFGIGLGSGYRPQGSMGGEPNFRGQANSLWLYQNDIGALIYRGIQDILHRQQRATTRQGRRMRFTPPLPKMLPA